MSNNFKNNIKNNIKNEDEKLVLNTNTDTSDEVKTEDTSENKDTATTKTFKIRKKIEDKNTRKSFPLYLDASVQKELDRIAKKTNYSRNELINMMINHCIENIEFED